MNENDQKLNSIIDDARNLNININDINKQNGDHSSDDTNFKLLNDDNSDYESCNSNDDDVNYEPIIAEQTDEPSTDDEYFSEIEKNLSEEELTKRKQTAIETKDEGNKYFKELSFEKSCELYTTALRLCPRVFAEERAVMYGNRSAARVHLNMRDKAILDCGKAIELKPDYLKPLLRRAQLLSASEEKLDDALSDYKRVLELDGDCADAKRACNELPQRILTRNEKMKTEMMGKLKELGNLVLRPFGLSTDNFKLTQNGETGGYSVNFQNN